MSRLAGLAIVAWALSSTSLSAETTARAESIVPARVAILSACPLTKPNPRQPDKQAGEGLESATAGAVGTMLAGVAGEIVGAGVTALAGALEEASRERAIGARGVTRFNFYAHQAPGRKYEFRDRLRPTEAYCLVLSVDDDSQIDLAESDLPTGGRFNAPNIALPLLVKEDFGKRPKLYVEAMLTPGPDGFVVEPAAVWYPSPFKGARRSRMPTEFHVTFATPDSSKTESPLGVPFAIARIPLPAIAPGEAFDYARLRHMGSALLPPRPETGSAATRKSSIASLYQAETNAKKELGLINETLANASSLGLTKAEIKAARIQKKRKELELERLQLAPSPVSPLWEPTKPEELGGTTVEARFLLIKNANRFGQAIAKALTNRSAAIGTAVTNVLTPKPAWSEAETQYVAAMLTVREKQAAYDEAAAGTDAAKKLTAEIALKNAQAAANGRAVAANKPLPYPNIL